VINQQMNSLFSRQQMSQMSGMGAGGGGLLGCWQDGMAGYRASHDAYFYLPPLSLKEELRFAVDDYLKDWDK